MAAPVTCVSAVALPCARLGAAPQPLQSSCALRMVVRVHCTKSRGPGGGRGAPAVCAASSSGGDAPRTSRNSPLRPARGCSSSCPWRTFCPRSFSLSAGVVCPALALGGSGGPPFDSIGGEGGGGGGGGAANPIAELADAAVSAQCEEVLLFDVSGMMCGGCASSVKRILESHPNVNSATVNVTTETALVRVFLDSQFSDLDTLASALAKELSECGFGAKRVTNKKRLKKEAV